MDCSDGVYDAYGARDSKFMSARMCGWLYKASGGKKMVVKFDRRWFVLEGGVLRYYTSESLETEKGSIPLSDVVGVRTLVQGSATFGTFPGRPALQVAPPLRRDVP